MNMNPIAFFLINVINVIKYAILVRVIMSWIRVNPNSRIVYFILQITEPVLRIFRNLLPRMGMIDLSPLIAFFVLDLAQYGIMNLFSGF